MSEDELPEGWTTSLLPDVVYFAGRIGWRGLKAEEYARSGPMLLSVHNLNNGPNVDFTNVNYVSRARYEESPEIKVRLNDVLLTKDGAGIGKTGFVAGLPAEATINSSLLLLRSFGALHPKFLFYSVIGPGMQSLVKEQITGSTTPHLFQKDIKQFELLIPPLAEQQRIVAKVEALLARVNAARQRLAKVPAILKRFRQSVLAAACSGRITVDWRASNPALETCEEMLERVRLERYAVYQQECMRAKQGGKQVPRQPSNLEPIVESVDGCLDVPWDWSWMTLENMCSARRHAMSSGPFGSALGTKDYTESGVPVIRGQNIERGHFVIKNLVYVSEEKAEQLSRSLAYPNDIVVVAVGVGAGESAILPYVLNRAILSQNCNKLTVDQSLVRPDFAILLLQMQIFFESLREKATDTARAFLSLTSLKRLILPVPPLPEQHEITRRVAALFRLADATEKRVAAATARAEKLTQAILAKAFRGELVPTEAELARVEHRDYEPASKLLERIRAERAGSTNGSSAAPTPRRKSVNKVRGNEN